MKRSIQVATSSHAMSTIMPRLKSSLLRPGKSNSILQHPRHSVAITPVRSVTSASALITTLQRKAGNRAVCRLLTAGSDVPALQLNPSRRRSGVSSYKLSRLMRRKTGKGLQNFFRALNTSLSTVAGKSISLSMSDYEVLRPSAFLQNKEVKSMALYMFEYNNAVKNMQKLCRIAPRAIRHACSVQANKGCGRVLKLRKLCTPQGRPKIVAYFLGLNGITPPSGPSVVLLGFDFMEFLEAMVHEGIHRRPGKAWHRQSRLGHVRYHPQHNNVMLPAISYRLCEGTVQIFTLRTISLMQRSGWFKGYVTNAYDSEVKYVKKILATHNKNLDFLRKAYFDDNSTLQVADLRGWQ